MSKGREVGRTKNCLISNQQSSEAGSQESCVKAPGVKADGDWGLPMKGPKCHAEELGLSSVSNRKPQEVLEQGNNHEQNN